jgi:hypothetical protein
MIGDRVYVRQAPDQRATEQFVTLDGIRIGLRCQFSAFDSRWRLWLLDLDGTVIRGPTRLVQGLDLFGDAHHDPRVPPGELRVFSVDGVPMDAATVDKAAVLYYRRSA